MASNQVALAAKLKLIWGAANERNYLDESVNFDEEEEAVN